MTKNVCLVCASKANLEPFKCCLHNNFLLHGYKKLKLGHEVPGFIQDDFVAVVEEVDGFVAHDEVRSFGLLEQECHSGLVALGRSLLLLVWVDEFVRSLLLLTILTAILFDL